MILYYGCSSFEIRIFLREENLKTAIKAFHSIPPAEAYF